MQKVAPDAQHNEGFWSSELRAALLWMFATDKAHTVSGESSRSFGRSRGLQDVAWAGFPPTRSTGSDNLASCHTKFERVSGRAAHPTSLRHAPLVDQVVRGFLV